MAEKKVKYVRFNEPAEDRLDELSRELDRPKSTLIRALVESEIGTADAVDVAMANLIRETARQLAHA